MVISTPYARDVEVLQQRAVRKEVDHTLSGDAHAAAKIKSLQLTHASGGSQPEESLVGDLWAARSDGDDHAKDR